MSKHIDRFMRRVIREIPGKPRREELECGHIVVRRDNRANRRRCLECAGEHYATQLPLPETISQRFARITRKATGWVQAWKRRTAV
jgi:hypothetical protein